MEARDFRFPTELRGELDDAQRLFLAEVEDVIRRLQPPQLDIDAIDARIEAGRLSILLPHRDDEQRTIIATVSKNEAVVSYSYEHEHF